MPILIFSPVKIIMGHPIALDATELVYQPVTEMAVEMIDIHLILVQKKR